VYDPYSSSPLHVGVDAAGGFQGSAGSGSAGSGSPVSASTGLGFDDGRRRDASYFNDLHSGQLSSPLPPPPPLPPSARQGGFAEDNPGFNKVRRASQILHRGDRRLSSQVSPLPQTQSQPEYDSQYPIGTGVWEDTEERMQVSVNPLQEQEQQRRAAALSMSPDEYQQRRASASGLHRQALMNSRRASYRPQVVHEEQQQLPPQVPKPRGSQFNN